MAAGAAGPWGPGRRSAALGFLVLALVSCQPAVDTGPPLPPPPQYVDVTMREYRFEYEPGIRAGRVVFRAHNAGTQLHQMRIFPLDDDVPPLNEQLHGSQRRTIAPLGEIVRPPGTSGVFALDLIPGQRYGLVCFVPEDDTIHALKGMNAEFRAAGEKGRTSTSSTTPTTGAEGP